MPGSFLTMQVCSGRTAKTDGQTEGSRESKKKGATMHGHRSGLLGVGAAGRDRKSAIVTAPERLRKKCRRAKNSVNNNGSGGLEKGTERSWTFP